MRKLLVLGFVSVGFLAGCTPPVPIVATLDGSNEEFVGSANPYKGEITGTVYPSGATCFGEYETFFTWDANSTYNLNGDIKCSDGRTGTWTATGSNNIGRGVGVLDGKKMRISFGNVGIINSY